MSVLRPSTACAITSPPLPPSPPFGPPYSMNFSRRNDTQPLPPSPERIYTLASSRNFILSFLYVWRLAFAFHHCTLQRLADVALIGNAFTLGVLAHGIEQFFRNSQI